MRASKRSISEAIASAGQPGRPSLVLLGREPNARAAIGSTPVSARPRALRIRSSRSRSSPLDVVRVVEAHILAALGQVLLVVDVARVVVRVVVADAAPELGGARVGGAAQRRGRVGGAGVADVAARLADRALDGVRLRRQRQVDRGLGERELALRQADVLDRVRGGDGDRQRLRVGVADVLGGEDDHPAGDEARVLAALEHGGEVVQRRVGVRAARGLDPGRDVVVVLVAALVVEDRLALHRVLGVGERDRPPVTVAHASSSAFSAVRASPPARAARNSITSSGDAAVGALAALERAPQQRLRCCSAVSSCSS